MDKKILIINTGGTISMVSSKSDKGIGDVLKPSKSWEEVIHNYQFLKDLKVDYTSLSKIIDSSDMDYTIWLEIAKIIEKNYDKYKGFIILHGTDTMAYTASALSFMLKNLKKTVILTGAQRPIQEIRSDGLQNLLTSIEIIEKQENECENLKEEEILPNIPEVCIFFRDNLFKGNRARKLNSNNYFGFSSPNYLPLGEAGSTVKIFKNRLLKMNNENFYVDYEMNPNVIMMDVFPSFNPEIFESIFTKNKKIKGLVLRTYGSGNTPKNERFLKVIKEIIDSKVVILNITQCTVGRVETGLYESNAFLTKLGVVNGHDITPESAITKLMYLLGKYKDINEIKVLLRKSIAGELTK
ncbi:MAG: asparaginase [Leptotrichiaceae bacterium]|nr:asparaginase [Leptotrichiaceae bacterium]MBP6280935.1 asparaginase [Leptotrichiaceae bacterium]MBP7100582.1 asparaginase [Leptotrichiaceae bacterium]MBP7739346.1 asparaginase [Leptotrichiaceae bacterium]MBP9629334.1 asparaginase [Leptotrichiaceae bacterium]